MFVNSEKIIVVSGKEQPLMTTREQLKIEKTRDEWKKLIAQDWKRTKQVGKDS